MPRTLAATSLLSAAVLASLVGCNIAPGDIPPRDHEAILAEPAAPATPVPTTLPNGGLFAYGNGMILAQSPDETNRAAAETAARQAQQSPASPQQARQSPTADLNKDGFITLDEVVAMRDAGLDDLEMVRRLNVTGQVFQLTSAQEDYLINHGVSRTVIDQIRKLSRPTTTQPPATPNAQ